MNEACRSLQLGRDRNGALELHILSLSLVERCPFVTGRERVYARGYARAAAAITLLDTYFIFRPLVRVVVQE